MITCQVCLLPQSECLKNDLKLIQPFKSDEYQVVGGYTTNRIDRVEKYMIGAYNKENGELYHHFSLFRQTRREIDIFNTMPLCVFEGYYNRLRFNKQQIIFLNIQSLPIGEKHKQILFTLLTEPGLDDYVSSLPPSPKRMP